MFHCSFNLEHLAPILRFQPLIFTVVFHLSIYLFIYLFIKIVYTSWYISSVCSAGQGNKSAAEKTIVDMKWQIKWLGLCVGLLVALKCSLGVTFWYPEYCNSWLSFSHGGVRYHNFCSTGNSMQKITNGKIIHMVGTWEREKCMCHFCGNS